MIKKPVKNFSSRNGQKPKFIVVHIMQGSMNGTYSWFNNPLSQVSSNYGIGLDGEIIEFVPPEYKAWANGYVTNNNNGIYHFNNPVLSECGSINPNAVSISVELEGFFNNPIPTKQWDALVNLCREDCVKYSIPMDENHIIGHYRIDPVNKINCPANVDFIKLVKSVQGIQNVNNWEEEAFDFLQGLGCSFSEKDFDSPMTRGEFFAGLKKFYLATKKV